MFVLIVGLLLIGVGVYTLKCDFPSIERCWQEVAGIAFGGALLERARSMFFDR